MPRRLALGFWVDPQTSSFWMRKRGKQTNIELEKRKTLKGSHKKRIERKENNAKQ